MFSSQRINLQETSLLEYLCHLSQILQVLMDQLEYKTKWRV